MRPLFDGAAVRDAVLGRVRTPDPREAESTEVIDDAYEDGDISGVVATPYHAISKPLEHAAEPRLRLGFNREQELADLLFRGRIRRIGPGVVASNGRSYRLHEVVRVLVAEGSDSDPYGLIGRVERQVELLRAGASFNGNRLRIGSATYVVERGVWVDPAEAPDPLPPIG